MSFTIFATRHSDSNTNHTTTHLRPDFLACRIRFWSLKWREAGSRDEKRWNYLIVYSCPCIAFTSHNKGRTKSVYRMHLQFYLNTWTTCPIPPWNKSRSCYSVLKGVKSDFCLWSSVSMFSVIVSFWFFLLWSSVLSLFLWSSVSVVFRLSVFSGRPFFIVFLLSVVVSQKVFKMCPQTVVGICQ